MSNAPVVVYGLFASDEGDVRYIGQTRRDPIDPKPAAMLQCARCGGREVIETRVGVMYVAGRARGGTKSLLCADCHRKGERVVLA